MFKTNLAYEIWKSKYRYGEETPLETFQRVARALASVEKNPDEWYEKFLKTMVRLDDHGEPIGLKCTTGGRITANIGTSFKKATLVNCFISAPVTGAAVEYTRKTDNGLIQYPVKYKTDESPDDLINIFLTIVEQAKTLASEGGYGINFDFIRPRGSLIKGTGIKHPGVVAYMKIWDAVSECIVQGDTDGYVNKIKNHLKSEEKFQEVKDIVKKSVRKGAMLAALSCVSGETLISTVMGKIPVKDLEGKNPLVYCSDDDNNIFIKKANKVWKTGHRKTVKIMFDDDSYLVCTPDHLIRLSNGLYKEAEKLTLGDEISTFHKIVYFTKGKSKIKPYYLIGVTGSKMLPEHLAMCRLKYGVYPKVVLKKDNESYDSESQEIHHIDGNSLNNNPENIELIPHIEHTYIFEKELQTKIKNLGNHTVISVMEWEEEDVYDISVPENHNFVANGIFVHNCSHPDAEEFICAKQTSGTLTKFNISIVLDDLFMKAVENDDYYDQVFNGIIYKRVKARDLYDLIMRSTYNRAEPGVLFSGNMMKNNPIAYLGELKCVNPCVRRGTLVATFNGLKPIEQIIKGELIQTTLGFEPVENIEIHENVNVYRITFSDGSYLDVSEGHIFHTQPNGVNSQKSWDNTVRLIDLSIGDFVRKDRYRFETQNNSSFSRDKGLFAGLFLGDGHIDANDKVCISVDQRDDSSYIYDLCDRLGFAHWNDNTAIDGFSRKIIIGGKGDNKSIDLLKDLGLNVELEATQKNFPYWWLNTNKEFLRGVLDGLLCSDGNVNDRYPQIQFKSTSLNLHNNLRHLMLYFGADYKVYKVGKVGEEHKILGRIIKRNFDVFEGVIDNDSILSVYRELSHLSHPEKNKKLKGIIKNTSLTGVKWKTKIENIEYIGTDTVYDLYAKESDDWNTCGIVSRGCGEIPGLSNITTVCLLGSPNLTQYVKINVEGNSYFDFEEYSEDIKTFMRMLDNVNDLTYSPLPSYQWVIENLRQVGMGINGLGSTLAMLKIPYNSPEAVKFTEEISKIKENLTWQTSALLAKEKGAFTAYNKELFESTEYFKSDRISEETKDMIRKYGVRNAKTTTCPPLGHSSIISDITSNGVEPIFLIEYERKVICRKWPEGLNVNNIREILKYHKEKDYEYWKGEYNGVNYYYEPHNRGLCEINIVRDYGYQWLLDNYPGEDYSKYLKTSRDIDIDDHLAIQKMVQYYNNQSVSKTATLPNKFPFDDFKDLYIKAWKYGLNGFTVYREGSMESVLSDINKVTNKSKEIIIKDIKLPNIFINGPTNIIKKEGKKFYLHFSYLPDDHKHEFPVVLWIYTNAKYKADELKICNKASHNLATLALKCGVDQKIVRESVDKANEDYPHNRLGRMISLCLRHNIPREDILVSLMNIDGDNISTLLTSVRKFLSKTLPDGTKLKKLKCPECGETLIMTGGCQQCPSCSWSACG